MVCKQYLLTEELMFHNCLNSLNQQLLKVMQLCDSGGRAKMVIADGDVRVDGAVELRKRCKIRKGQLVEFEGQSILVV